MQLKKAPLYVMYVILGTGVLLLLFYVGSTNMFNTPFQKPVNTAITSIPEPKRPSGNISITSEIPGLSAVLNNRVYLMTKLKELDFWSGEKKIYETKSSIYQDIKSLKIILTNQEQSINQVFNNVEGQTRLNYSTGIIYEASLNQIELYLHASPDEVKRRKLSDLEKIFSSIALKRLYGVKNYVDKGQDLDYVKEYEAFISLEAK